MKRFTFFQLPLIVWFIVCTILFTIPGSSLPKEDWLDKIYFDKWVHIGLFVILSFLAGRAFYSAVPLSKRMRYFILCGVLCIAYGVAIEFIQKYFIPMRSFDVGDIMADTTGSIIGTWFCAKRFIKK